MRKDLIKERNGFECVGIRFHACTDKHWPVLQGSPLCVWFGTAKTQTGTNVVPRQP